MAPTLFAVSLIPMVLATGEFAIGEALLPFSDARHVADFIRQSALHDRPLVGISRPDAQSVGALLDRPIFYPLDGRTGTFAIWGSARPTPPTLAEIKAATDTLLLRDCQIALISTLDTDVPASLRAGVRLIYETPRRPMSGNRFRVWLESAPTSARCPAASPT